MGDLQRVLGLRSLILITITSVMGSGVFFLPAVGAAIAGNASILAWLVLGICSMYTAACIAELVSIYPHAGGIYEYCKHAYGTLTAFIVGWISWIVGNVTAAMLIVAAIDYLLPADQYAVHQLFSLSVTKTIICLLLLCVFNFIAYRGIKISSSVLTAFSCTTIFIILAIVIPAIPQIQLSNLTSFFSPSYLVEQLPLIFVTIFFIAETFTGHESVTFLAEETKDPQKLIPKALMYATLAIFILVMSLVIASLGVIPASQFGQFNAPFVELGKAIYGAWAVTAIKLITYLAIIGSAASWIVTMPRLLLALARDKLLPKAFHEIHEVFGTPHKAIAFQTIISSFFILLAFNGSGYRTLLQLLIPLIFIMMTPVILAVTVLRFKEPKLERTFKVPFGKVGPVILVIAQLAIIASWLILTPDAPLLFRTSLSFVLLAIPIYVLFLAIHSPKTDEVIQNALAYLGLIYENIFIPKSKAAQVTMFLGNIKQQKVLELGCQVGTMTKTLANNVGKKGVVIALDSGDWDLQLTQRRLRNYPNVQIMKVGDLTSIPKEIKSVDAVVSVGQSSTIKDVKIALKAISKVLPKGGKIAFMEYDRFFWMLPNCEWLESDSMIRELFGEARFDVEVQRQKGLLWQYIYIFGTKN